MRVYEIAREVGIPNKELIAKIRTLGLEVNNHMSSLDADDVVRVKRAIEKDRRDNTVTKRLSSTVLRRRSKKQAGGDGSAAEAVVREAAEAPRQQAQPSVRDAGRAPEPVRRRPVEPAQPKPAVEVRSQPTPAPEPREPTPASQAPSQPASQPAETRQAPAEPAAPQQREPAAPAVGEQPPPVEAKREPAAERQPEPQTAEPPAHAPPAESEPAPAKPQPSHIIDANLSLPRRRPQEPAKPVARPAEPPRDLSAGAEPVAMPAPKEEELEYKARSQFERDLDRARAQAADRDKERQAVRERELQKTTGARGDKPEVGSVINLPMTKIKITERAPAARGRFERPGNRLQQQRRGGRRQEARGKRRPPAGKKGKQTQITTPAEHKRIIKIEDTIMVSELARQMGLKSTELLKKLWGMGMVGVNINNAIDFETANIVAGDFGYDVHNVAFQEDAVLESGQEDSDEDLVPRAPVVTVMGHVDHGKTTLLDAIRHTRVAAGEAGGITQHIAAYRVPVGDQGDLVFLDTPGHEAFTAMRARGAQTTDIVVLVVAATDGAMPQTLEALAHAKAAGVPIIVAVNKIDAPGAQPDRVRQQLSERELIPEEWGGDTQYINISALKNEGIDTLLEAIGLQAELLELTANPDKPAAGAVVEARLDRARGPVATVLIQEGTLQIGDVVVAGEIMGKVRAMLDDSGENIDEAGPSTPVEVLGLDGVPEAGERLQVTDEKTAKQVVEHRRQQLRKKELAESAKLSLESIMAKIQEGGAKELKVVLKADVQGSAEAVREALVKLSTPKVGVNVISAGVGGITESDVNLAKAGGAIIIGFHVRPAGKAGKVAQQEGVDIKLYNVIYEALDEVRAAMAGLLAPIKKEREIGKLQVRETFNISKVGRIAGCMVTDGVITRKSLLRVIRDAVQVYEGRVAQLKRFKDDASEVKEGYECGLQIDGYNEVQVGDIVEAYDIVEEAATL